MRKYLFILLLCITTSASGQFFAPQQKPMLGLQVNRAHTLSKGLVGCWLFNEGSGGQVFDLSGNNYTGTLVNDTRWVPGKFGSTLDFDGGGDYVSLPRNFNFSQNGACSLWFWTDAVVSTDTIFESITGGTNLWGMQVKSNKLTAGYYNGSYDAKSVGFTDITSWHHFVFSRNSGSSSAYLDGVEMTLTDNPALDTAPNITHIGQAGDRADLSFNGRIDNVLIYNRPLSASEAAVLCREPFIMFEPDWNWILYGGIAVPSVGGGQLIFINQF